MEAQTWKTASNAAATRSSHKRNEWFFWIDGRTASPTLRCGRELGLGEAGQGPTPDTTEYFGNFLEGVARLLARDLQVPSHEGTSGPSGRHSLRR